MSQNSNDSSSKEMQDKQPPLPEENDTEEENAPELNAEMEEEQPRIVEENELKEKDGLQDHHPILTESEEENLEKAITDFVVERQTTLEDDEAKGIIKNTLNRNLSNSDCEEIIGRITRKLRRGRETRARKDLPSQGLSSSSLEGELSLNIIDALCKTIEEDTAEREAGQDLEVVGDGEGDDLGVVGQPSESETQQSESENNDGEGESETQPSESENNESVDSREVLEDNSDTATSTTSTDDENQYHIHRRR